MNQALKREKNQSLFFLLRTNIIARVRDKTWLPHIKLNKTIATKTVQRGKNNLKIEYFSAKQCDFKTSQPAIFVKRDTREEIMKHITQQIRTTLVFHCSVILSLGHGNRPSFLHEWSSLLFQDDRKFDAIFTFLQWNQLI